MTIARPLRPWLWCALFLACIWLPILWLDAHSELFSRTHSRAISNLDQYQPRKLDYLLLGDSMLSASLPADEGSQHPLAGSRQWQLYWVASGGWQDFSPYLERIRAHKANTIIVQDSLLQTHPATPLPTRLRLVTSQWLRTKLGRPHPPQAGVIRPQNTRPKRPRSATETTALRQQITQGYRDSLPIPPKAIAFIKQLKSDGSRLVVIRLPRSNALQGGIAQSQWQQQLQQALAALDVDYIPLGGPMPDDHYLDGSHANPIGRSQRQAQLEHWLTPPRKPQANQPQTHQPQTHQPQTHQP